MVTGSRIGRSGFDSAQPLSVVDATQIQNLGIVNVGDVIRTLPQNTPFFTDTNVGIGNFNVGAQLANLRGLNPYFGTRTLTLVDTKRVVPNTEGGAVDLTLVPSMLVGRTEVVTGGASAAYGSDAIAGVVNVILDTKLEGIQGAGRLRPDGSKRRDRSARLDRVGPRLQQRQGPPAARRRVSAPGSDRTSARRIAIGASSPGSSAPTPPLRPAMGYPNFVVAPNAKYATSDNGIIAPCLNAGCAPGTGRGPFQTLNAAGTALSAYDPGMWPGRFRRPRRRRRLDSRL